MALFLLELANEPATRADVSTWLPVLADKLHKSGGMVIEAQIATDLGRTYVIVEHTDRASLERTLAGIQPPIRDLAPVRLVGALLEEVKAAPGPANYLVEWDLPIGLSMERYLSRKAEKAPLYAQVPEVKFRRTYVCEDMSKCLCLYEAPDQQAVVKARQAVGAPVHRLSGVEGTS
jgi:hypothetical protein